MTISLPRPPAPTPVAPAVRVRPVGSRRPAGFIRVPFLLVQEARPPIIAIFTIRMVVATGLVRSYSDRAVLLTLGWICLTTAAYVYNGIRDLDGDRANSSTRPLASGRLSIPTAVVAATTLAAAGLAICWLVGPVEGAAGTSSLALGWAYSAGPALKRSWIACSLTVGVAAALTYTAGCRVAGDSVGTWAMLMVWSAWIGLLSAAKDLSDVEGDRLDGRRTLPVLLGLERSARVLIVVAVVTGAGFLVATDRLAPALRPVAWVLLTGSLLVILRLSRVRSGQDRHSLRGPYRAFMLTQFAVNAALLAGLS